MAKGRNDEVEFNMSLDKIHILLICILVFGFSIRLYYLDKNKAIWWDEGVYLSKAKGIAFGKEFCGWEDLRPVFLPAMLGFVFKFIGASEFAAKLIVSLLGTVSIFFLYAIIEKLYDKKLALASAAVFSTSWIHIFFSIRVLTDIPSTFFFLLVLYLYTNLSETPKKWVFIGFSSVLAFMTRFPTIIVLLLISMHLLVKRGPKVFKDRNMYFVFVGISIPLIMYFAYNYAIYGNPLLPVLAAPGGVVDPFPATYFFTSGGHIFTIPLYIMWVLGLFIALLKWKKNSLMILWLVTVLLVFSSIPRKEPRYIMPVLPCVSFLSIFPLLLFKKSLKEYFDPVLIFSVLVFAYFQLDYGHNMIMGKADSYEPIKTAGLWLKANTPIDSKVITQSVPQVCFYSEREVIGGFPGEYAGFLEREKGADYLMVSAWEPHPEYAFALNYTIIYNQPTVIIFKT